MYTLGPTVFNAKISEKKPNFCFDTYPSVKPRGSLFSKMDSSKSVFDGSVIFSIHVNPRIERFSFKNLGKKRQNFAELIVVAFWVETSCSLILDF
tara:strand:- start:111 stop:395 length:285 start_codon:yes stop_codon:yes gene_type:complete